MADNIEVADEMPEPRRAGGRAGDGFRWSDWFERVAADHPHKAVCLEMTHWRGAEQVKYRVEHGQVDVVGGADAWEITQVKRRGSNGEWNGSQLWVKYHG